MKEPHFNELRHLRGHLRVNFLTGLQVYRDQQKPVKVEEEHLRRLKSSGQLQQGAGRRVGLDGDEYAHQLARTTVGRLPHFTAGS